MSAQAKRIIARYRTATGLDPKRQLDALEDELLTLQGLQEGIEDFIFIEESVTTLLAKIRDLAQKHPGLQECHRHMTQAMDVFHRNVLRGWSASADDVDTEIDRVQDEIEALRGTN